MCSPGLVLGSGHAHLAGLWGRYLSGHLGVGLSEAPGAGGVNVSLLRNEQVPTGLLACIRVGTGRSAAFFPEGGAGHWAWLRAPRDSTLPQAWVGCGGGLGGRL